MLVTANIDMAESKVSTEAFGFAACSHRSPSERKLLVRRQNMESAKF